MDERCRQRVVSVTTLAERRCQARRVARRARGSAWYLTCALAVLGCKDEKKCDDAIATARKAVELSDFASARNWREHTWKMCGDRAMVDTLDQDILAAEAAAATKLEEARKLAEQQAQAQIDSAQKLWLKYDAFEPKDKTRNNLDKLLQRAQALGQPLEPEYKAQFDAYNAKEHARRLGALAAP